MQKKQFPKKHLGQHFLVNQGVLKRIVKCCNLNEDETILEIGPGRGALTHLVFKHVRQLIAIEKDKTLLTKLEEEILTENVIVINGDILKFNFNVFNEKIKVIGNIPYNISSPIVEKLINNRAMIKSAFLTTQLEFGKRLAARTVYAPRNRQRIGGNSGYMYDLGCFRNWGQGHLVGFGVEPFILPHGFVMKPE